jgi:hypothetical protein
MNYATFPQIIQCINRNVQIENKKEHRFSAPNFRSLDLFFQFNALVLKLELLFLIKNLIREFCSNLPNSGSSNSKVQKLILSK